MLLEKKNHFEKEEYRQTDRFIYLTKIYIIRLYNLEIISS